MTKSKKLAIVSLLIAVVFLVLGAINTSSAIKSYNDFQDGIKSYNQFADAEGTLIGDYAAKLAQQAFSSSETAKTIQKQMYKEFAMASVFVLVGLIFVAVSISNFVKKEE